MIRKNTRTVLSLSALVLLISGAVLYAGPLDPPAGAVSGTYKTLSDIEPRTAINATNTPGDADSRFKISQPGSYYLTGNVTGASGKHGIEIAADGVTVDLNGFDLRGVAGSLDGVSVTATNLSNITVVNGSVRNWGDDGVDLATATTNCRVEGVLANGNAGNGISTNSASTISNCSASSNTGIGVFATLNSTILNCSASNNTGNGISTNGGSVISKCSATSNSGSGFSAGVGTSVVDCAAKFNTLDGIVCASSCQVRGNGCFSNSGTGIHATGSDNRIEGNNCTLADRGIDVDSAGNIIIRNTCSGNTIVNWDIVINNYYGPIIDRTGAATAAVNGSAAASTLATTDPHANFSY